MIQVNAAITLRCLHSSCLLDERAQTISKDENVRTSLHSKLGRISKQLKCAPIITGGMEDHIHLLARFARTITQAEWVKELKRVSNNLAETGILDSNL